MKWLKRKEQTGDYHYVKGPNGGEYEFAKDSPYGTAVPDELADKLLATGEFVELNTEWHKKRNADLSGGIIAQAIKALPPDVRREVETALKNRPKRR